MNIIKQKQIFSILFKTSIIKYFFNELVIFIKNCKNFANAISKNNDIVFII